MLAEATSLASGAPEARDLKRGSESVCFKARGNERMCAAPAVATTHTTYNNYEGSSYKAVSVECGGKIEEEISRGIPADTTNKYTRNRNSTIFYH